MKFTPLKPGTKGLKPGKGLQPSGKPWPRKPGSRMKARKRSCPPPTVAERDRRDRMTEIGCVVGWLRLGARLAGGVHHLNTGGKHGQKVLGEAATICLNDWSHQGRVLTEYGWDAAMCRAKLGPSFAREPRAFRALFGGFDALLAEQERLLETPPL